MIIRKANIYRLHPTEQQASTLMQWFSVVRRVFNLALEQRKYWYRPGRNFTFASQCREVTALRNEFDWIKALPVHPLQQAMKDLDRAYQNWFSGRAAYPTFRKRGINDTMRFSDPATFSFRKLTRRIGEVKIPKLDWVRLRLDRAIPANIRNITMACRAGIWTVSAQYEAEIADPAPSTLPPVGIDRGIAVFATLSNGVMIAPTNYTNGPNF
jgi:putative transposase